MKVAAELTRPLGRMRSIGLIAALIGGLGSGAGFYWDREHFYAAYLTAFLYGLSLSLGCLGIAMIHGMTSGAWGQMIRRIVESAYATLPLMALLFLPLLLSVDHIYEWADDYFVQQHLSVLKKADYLNVVGYQGRAVAYFVIWLVLGWILNATSPNDEQGGETPRSLRRQQVSGLGFMAYGFTVTLAMVDWAMSLEPEWYSTMYGLIHIAGQGVCALSLAIVILSKLRSYRPWSRTVTSKRLNDLGSMLLAAVMFWAYCSFFQYLVIWSGNLPEENEWYVRRSTSGWQYLAIALMLLHFAVPFLLLLSKSIKRNPVTLGRVATLLLVMHYVDLYWIVVPGFERDESQHRLHLQWQSVPSLLLVSGLWLWAFAGRLAYRIRLPIDDPELKERVNEPIIRTASA